MPSDLHAAPGVSKTAQVPNVPPAAAQSDAAPDDSLLVQQLKQLREAYALFREPFDQVRVPDNDRNGICPEE
jgi:hypothetical protein